MAISNMFYANVVFDQDPNFRHASRELLLIRPPTNGNATKTCNQSSRITPHHDALHELFFVKSPL